MKFLESRRGAILDVAGDNLVHAAVFTCMAIGWSLAARAAWPLALGAITVASTVWVAAIVHRRHRPEVRASMGRDASSPLSLLADALVSRDFIYLIVALAAVGRAAWFLVPTAVGAPLFLLLLAWIGRDRRPGPGVVRRVASL